MKEVKIIISIFIIGIIATVIAFMVNHKNGSIKNDSKDKTKYKYNINTNNSNNNKYNMNDSIDSLKIETIDEYIEYLEYIKVQIKPVELMELAEVDKERANHYKESDALRSKKGTEILQNLIYGAYKNLFSIIIQKNQTWTDLPLTKHFRSKFNEKDGCIKEFDFNSKYISVFDMKDKIFSVEKSYIPDDAYEKYPKEVIDYMLEYNGAYNMDYYNYKFVLDEEGYLDDIIFTGITPHMVEGRFVDEGE